jgi:hypothetical protein
MSLITKEEAHMWAWFAANAPKSKRGADNKLLPTTPEEAAQWADFMLVEFKNRTE